MTTQEELEPAMMQAVTQDSFGGPEVLYMTSVPRPTPLPTEVLVRVHAAGVNPVDWKSRQGNGVFGILGEPPFVLGWDIAGVVHEVGFGVTTLAPGDDVYGMPWFPREAGAYAEYVTAPSRMFARKPGSLTHERAAAVPLAGLTAWQALIDTAQIAQGSNVLITAAAGGVGHLAVQIAKYRGAHVIGTASTRNHAWLADLGADETIDYQTTHFADVLRNVDVLLDLAGDATNIRSLKSIRSGGILIAVSSSITREIRAAADACGIRVTPILVEPDGPTLQVISSLIDAGDLLVEVAAAFPLDRVGDAHRLGEHGHNRGKLVLTV